MEDATTSTAEDTRSLRGYTGPSACCPHREVCVSRRKNGHFCWCCGRMRPNERFSGSNHRRHLCRECAHLPAEEREYRQGERDIERLLHDGLYVPRRRAQFSRFLDHPNARVRELAQRILAEQRSGAEVVAGRRASTQYGGEAVMKLKALKDTLPFSYAIARTGGYDRRPTNLRRGVGPYGWDAPSRPEVSGIRAPQPSSAPGDRTEAARSRGASSRGLPRQPRRPAHENPAHFFAKIRDGRH